MAEPNLPLPESIGRPRMTDGASSRSNHRSGWTSHWHHVPPPIDDLEGFIRAINRVTDKHHYEIVFGGHRQTCAIVRSCRRPVTPSAGRRSQVGPDPTARGSALRSLGLYRKVRRCRSSHPELVRSLAHPSLPSPPAQARRAKSMGPRCQPLRVHPEGLV